MSTHTDSKESKGVGSHKTWEQLAGDAVGTIYVDRHEDGLRFLVMRGPASLCAYLGVPKSHPLAGHSYDDVTINCHGGLTFASEGGFKTFPSEWFWYGWDYSHLDDACFYDLRYEKDSGDHKWTVEEVEGDSWGAICDFKHLMKLSEAITNRQAKGGR